MQKHTYEVHLLTHARPEDKSNLLRIWENNLYNKEQAEHRWAWFAENPILVQHYLLKVDGATEGSVTVVPKTFSIGADFRQVGGLLTDMSVNEDHRNMKAAMVLLKQSTEEALSLGCNFLFGTPSTNSYPIFKRKFNKLADYKKYVKILNYQPILKQRVGGEGLANILAPVVNKAIAAVDHLRGWYVGYNPNRDSMMAVESYRSGAFDFYAEDRTWKDITETKTFIGDRSRKRLAWRYWGVYQYTSWKYDYHVFTTNFGSLVYIVDDNFRASVIDLLIDPQYKNLPNFVALMRTFEMWCRKNGMIDSIAVEFAGFPHIHENLLFLGYSERANGHDIWIDKNATIDINSSFWTSAEGDFI